MSDSDTSGRGTLEAFAPDAAESLRWLCHHSPVSQVDVASIRWACSSAQSLPSLPTDTDPAADTASGSAPDSYPDPARPDGSPQDGSAVTEFATQFSLDVSSLDGDCRDMFLAEAGGEAFGAVQAIYVADMAPRVMAVLDRLFGRSEWDLRPAEACPPEQFWSEIESFLTKGHSLSRLDPVLSELVRIRGARQHNCRLCRSLRSRPALVGGATESTFDAIDEPGWPRLPDEARTALSLTDAIIWHPARIDDDLRERVRSTFDSESVVELVLDVMRNAANKIAVALDADQAHVTDGVEIYEIDSDGVAHYQLTAP